MLEAVENFPLTSRICFVSKAQRARAWRHQGEGGITLAPLGRTAQSARDHLPRWRISSGRTTVRDDSDLPAPRYLRRGTTDRSWVSNRRVCRGRSTTRPAPGPAGWRGYGREAHVPPGVAVGNRPGSWRKASPKVGNLPRMAA